MSELVRMTLFVGGSLAFSVIYMSILLRFERKRESRTKHDPDFEQRRARKSAILLGTTVVWLLAAASGLMLFGSGLALFVGLIANQIEITEGVFLAALFIFVTPIYFWSHRTLGSLLQAPALDD